MNEEITFTQFESETYLDPDYEQAQEQLAFDWMETIGDNFDQE